MDLGNTLDAASTNYLKQEVEFWYRDLEWTTLARAQQHQTLHPFEGPVTSDIYRRVPQLAIQNVFTDLPLGLVWTTESEISNFTHAPNPFTHSYPTLGSRYQLRPG